MLKKYQLPIIVNGYLKAIADERNSTKTCYLMAKNMVRVLLSEISARESNGELASGVVEDGTDGDKYGLYCIGDYEITVTHYASEGEVVVTITMADENGGYADTNIIIEHTPESIEIYGNHAPKYHGWTVSR